ncbi:MAG: hypothetical protein WA058_02415 [Minisyncoccia bacterium]
MPPRRNSTPPPQVMTWKKAMPVLIVAALFDLTRAFFNMFWFFGPAIAAAYCTSKVSGWVGSAWGLTAAACAAGATVAGGAASAITIPFGVIMADATGLIAFLVLGLWILITNARIIKTVAGGSLQFAGAFAVGEMPIIGALPILSAALIRIYKIQIRTEKAAFEKWEQEQIAAQLQQRNQQIQQAAQMQAQLQVRAAQQVAANDAAYMQAANEERYEEIPEEVRKAA